MTVDEFGIPDGPINREPLTYPEPGVHPSAALRAEILGDVFRKAGVEWGAYDERIATWFVQTADWSTFAVVASWIKRAGQGIGQAPTDPATPSLRDCTTCEHHLPATPAEEQCNPDGCGCTGYPEACDVSAAPPGATFPITNCPSWEARQ